MTDKSKTLLLIRHAQSAENVKVHHVCEGIVSVRNGCPPSWKAWESLGGLLTLVESNPKLSKLGTRQIKDMHMILRDADFWTRFRPDIVVCSPLLRAQETCQGVLPINDGSAELKVEIMADLTEASPYEHVFSKTLMERIERFKRWLASCEHETIVVVGHSQYFKKMLDQPTLMRNVDVWEVTLKIANNENVGNGTSSSSGSNGDESVVLSWHDLQLRYRTELADEHPYDKLQAKLRNGSNNTNNSSSSSSTPTPTSSTISNTKKKSRWEDEEDDDEVINDLTEEPICRICQMTAAEMPNMRLIKPCRCIGSLQYVHLECLNRWRETSDAAHMTCSVCNTHYQLQRTWLADLFMSERGAMLVTAWFIITVILVTGVILHVGLGWIHVDVARRIYKFLEIHPWWRQCRLDYSTFQALLSHLLGHNVDMGLSNNDHVVFNEQLPENSHLSNPWNPWNIVIFVSTLKSGISRGWVVLRLMVQVLRPPMVYYLLLCNDSATRIVDVILLGLLLVGGSGFLHYLYGEIKVAINLGAFRGDRGLDNPGLQRLAMLGMWLASLGNRALTRLGLFGGCCIAIREVYSSTIVRGRALAHNLGESILEYSAGRDTRTT